MEDFQLYNYCVHLGEYLPFEPIFVKAGGTSLRFTHQHAALQSCSLDMELDAEDQPILYPDNPCHYGYVFGGIDGPGIDIFDWFLCGA